MSNPKPIEQLLHEARKPEGVYQKIARVTSMLCKQGIGKNDKNEYDKYMFRGIDAVYNALAPAISEVGLVILPEVIERESVERQAKGGGALFYVTLKVRYHFVSADDASTHVVVAYGEAMDRGDKATNKAMSAAFKYACFQAFCIPTEAADADTESHEVKRGAVADAMVDIKVDREKVEAMAAHIDECFTLEGEGRTAVLECVDREALEDLIASLKADADLKIAVWGELGSKVRSFIKAFEKGEA